MYSIYNPYSIFLIGGAEQYEQRKANYMYERLGPTNHKLPKSLRINNKSPEEIDRLIEF